jgi:murein DD-endopeptidase MepM/ murein hydrolase activator NlpD
MMKKKTVLHKLTAAVLSVVIASVSLTVSSGVEYSEAGVQSYEDLIYATDQKLAEAEEVLREIQRDQAKTYDQIMQYDKILELNEELRRLTEDQIEALNQQIADTRQAAIDTERKLENQKKMLLDRMAEAYMDNTTDYLELLLSSTSLFDFLKKLDYVSAIMHYDQNLIEQMGHEQERLAEYEQLLVAAEEEQRLHLAELDERIAEYAAAEEEKYDYILSLKENEQLWTENYAYNSYLVDTLNRELEDYLQKMEEQRRQEEELARQLEENARLYEETNSYYGSLTECWPLEAGVTYRVSSEQGYRYLWGIQDYHLGIDLACVSGTEVYSFNGGTVLKSESHWSYGNYVLIDHGGGISTLYAHMSTRLVSAGDRVEPGQLVGYVGLTGNTTGYHLHFEVRENGKVVNPRGYLVFP